MPLAFSFSFYKCHTRSQWKLLVSSYLSFRVGVGSIILPIWQMWKLRTRKWWDWDVNLGGWGSGSFKVNNPRVSSGPWEPLFPHPSYLVTRRALCHYLAGEKKEKSLKRWEKKEGPESRPWTPPVLSSWGGLDACSQATRSSGCVCSAPTFPRPSLFWLTGSPPTRGSGETATSNCNLGVITFAREGGGGGKTSKPGP